MMQITFAIATLLSEVASKNFSKCKLRAQLQSLNAAALPKQVIHQ